MKIEMQRLLVCVLASATLFVTGCDAGSSSASIGKEGEPHQHPLTRVEEISATCVDEGTKAYWECEECNVKFFDVDGKYSVSNSDLKIPVLEHSLEFVEAVEATEEKEGNI